MMRWVLVVAVTGCSSSPATKTRLGSASVDGTIAGHMFPADSSSYWVHDSAQLVIVGGPGSCHAQLTEELSFDIGVLLPGASLMPLTEPGMFHIGYNSDTQVDFSGTFFPDPAAPARYILLSGGTITVSTVSDRELGGTFDLTFMDGSIITGSFDAPAC